LSNSAHEEFTKMTTVGSVHIRGSATLMAPVQAAAEGFMGEQRGLIATVSGGGTGRGIRSVIDGTADLAMSSAELDGGDRKKAARQGKELAVHLLAHDAILPCVHPDNPVRDLSIEQLRSVYSGETTNWRELGGHDAPIAVTSYDPLSGTYEAWHALVLRDESITPKATILETSALRARVAKDPNAIGYIAHTFLDASVRAVSVEGKAATAETIRSSAYPLRRPLSLVSLKAPSGAVQRFVAYMLDPAKGQRLLAAAGNVPVT